MPRPKSYRVHYCPYEHLTYLTTARCLWPHATVFVDTTDHRWTHPRKGMGGPYVVTSSCRHGRVDTAHFFTEQARAEKFLELWDSCGGRCRGRCRGDHELRFLGDIANIAPELTGKLRLKLVAARAPFPS